MSSKPLPVPPTSPNIWGTRTSPYDTASPPPHTSSPTSSYQTTSSSSPITTSPINNSNYQNIHPSNASPITASPINSNYQSIPPSHASPTTSHTSHYQTTSPSNTSPVITPYQSIVTATPSSVSNDTPNSSTNSLPPSAFMPSTNSLPSASSMLSASSIILTRENASNSSYASYGATSNSSYGGGNYGYNAALSNQHTSQASRNPNWVGERIAVTDMTYEYREISFDEIKLDDVAIGSGAFGVVHKGIWRGATVAVKKLLVVMDEHLLAQEVRREATIIQGVANHPNIVRFYGACTKKQPYCLVTSLYQRGSVFSLLRKVNLEWRTVVGFARDAAAGILHLHCENVIHRDIASRNLLVDDQWTVRISDFGLARIKVKANSQTKSSVGPVKWMAPEALKDKSYSPKSDSYSFGVLLWELVARKEPYEDMEAIQVALGVLHDGLRPTVPPDTPQAYVDLMTKCWHADPDKRPTFHEILDTLQDYYNTLPQVTDPATTPGLNGSTGTPTGSNSAAIAYSVSSTSSGIYPRQSAMDANQDLECPICGEVFENVVETPCCSSCYCRKCIKDWIAKSNSCPECRASIQENKLKANIPVQRWVDNMPTECPYAKNGCTDRVTRGILNEHQAKCGFALVECDGYHQFLNSLEQKVTEPSIGTNTSPTHSNNSTSSATNSSGGSASMSPPLTRNNNKQSGESVAASPSNSSSPSVHSSSTPSSPLVKTNAEWCPNAIKQAKPCGHILKRELANHKAHQCPFRTVLCRMECGAQIRVIQMEDHLQICPNVEVPCPNECGLRTKRGLLQQHRDTDCEFQSISCKYCAWGCKTDRIRKDMWEHYENAAQTHVTLAESFVGAKQSKIVQLKEAREDLLKRFAQTKEENVHLRLTIEGLAALKPHLPHHSLYSEPVILPSFLVIPEHSDAMASITLESDLRTVSYQQPSKFFSAKIAPSKPVIVRGDRMIPNANVTYYFEVSLKSLGKDGAIGIGLVSPGYEIFSMPGWQSYTFGYHADDGRKYGFPNHQFGNMYGPLCQKDDVVGCGWNQVQSKLFYTLNGKSLGIAFENVTGEYFVAIGLHTHGAKLKINFGQDPFMYDIAKNNV